MKPDQSENKGNVHVSWEASGHLNFLFIFAMERVAHVGQQLSVGEVTAGPHCVDEGIAGGPRGPITGHIGIRAGLVVLAPGEHDGVCLRGASLGSYVLGVAFVAQS